MLLLDFTEYITLNAQGDVLCENSVPINYLDNY